MVLTSCSTVSGTIGNILHGQCTWQSHHHDCDQLYLVLDPLLPMHLAFSPPWLWPAVSCFGSSTTNHICIAIAMGYPTIASLTTTFLPTVVIATSNITVIAIPILFLWPLPTISLLLSTSSWHGCNATNAPITATKPTFLMVTLWFPCQQSPTWLQCSQCSHHYHEQLSHCPQCSWYLHHSNWQCHHHICDGLQHRILHLKLFDYVIAIGNFTPMALTKLTAVTMTSYILFWKYYWPYGCCNSVITISLTMW